MPKMSDPTDAAAEYDSKFGDGTNPLGTVARMMRSKKTTHAPAPAKTERPPLSAEQQKLSDSISDGNGGAGTGPMLPNGMKKGGKVKASKNFRGYGKAKKV